MVQEGRGSVMGKIVGLWGGHDTSVCVLQDGIPIFHTELERHSRIKCDRGDPIKLLQEHYNLDNIDCFATVYPLDTLAKYEGYNEIKRLGKPLHIMGHHCAHAASSFYGSHFDEALIITIDGGGIEDENGFPSSTTFWKGQGTKIERLATLHSDQLNVGGLWTRCTKYIWGLNSGYPQGHCAGSVMAMASYGRPNITYLEEFRAFFNINMNNVCQTPQGHTPGMDASDPRTPKHPFLYKYKLIAQRSQQDAFDLAWAFQTSTEEVINQLVEYGLKLMPGVKNICFAGGVSLNCVAIGKLLTTLKGVDIYVPFAPYDAGLSIGAAQYVNHHILNKPRVNWDDNMSPFLGVLYDDNYIKNIIEEFEINKKITSTSTTDDDVIQLLNDGNVIAIFNGRPESGARALGARSILCNPKLAEMKDKINQKIKGRQTYRPSAPSILRENVSDWFEIDHESPYMQYALQVKPEMAKKIPAVVHVDNSARLQTVTRKDNPWYYEFLKKWEVLSGVPILLNTSYNTHSPINETPKDALDCFCGTNLDFLYFPTQNLLIKKK
jgi:carbamoyltransferase